MSFQLEIQQQYQRHNCLSLLISCHSSTKTDASVKPKTKLNEKKSKIKRLRKKQSLLKLKVISSGKLKSTRVIPKHKKGCLPTQATLSGCSTTLEQKRSFQPQFGSHYLFIYLSIYLFIHLFTALLDVRHCPKLQSRAI